MLHEGALTVTRCTAAATARPTFVLDAGRKMACAARDLLADRGAEVHGPSDLVATATDAVPARPERHVDLPVLPTEIIAPALRHLIDVSESPMAGARTCTMSYAVLDQLLHHPLTDASVQAFTADWAALQMSLADTPTRSTV